MAKVKVRQIKSTIKRPARQKATIKALGLGRINKSVELELTPQVEGMINRVGHLLEIEKL